MKKMFLGCFLALSMCFGLCAGALEDAQFKQYVETTKNDKDNPKGMTVCADNTYRIIYVAMPAAVNYSSVTPQVLKEMKKELVAEAAKEKEDCKIIKDLKITVVYTFITTDKRMFTVVLSHKDL